jgi:hypothetical protein
MKVLLRIFVILFSFYFTLSVGLVAYELVTKGQWCTYVNYFGERVIMGQELATLKVQDESGKTVGKIKGYAFPDSDKTVTRIKDANGKYVYADNAKLPALLQTVETLWYPALSIVRSKKFADAAGGALMLTALLIPYILCIIYGRNRRKKPEEQ